MLLVLVLRVRMSTQAVLLALLVLLVLLVLLALVVLMVLMVRVETRSRDLGVLLIHRQWMRHRHRHRHCHRHRHRQRQHLLRQALEKHIQI